MYNMPVAHKTGYSLELYAYARGGARRSPQKKRIFTMFEFTDQHLLCFGLVLALSILFPDWQWSTWTVAGGALLLATLVGHEVAAREPVRVSQPGARGYRTVNNL